MLLCGMIPERIKSLPLKNVSVSTLLVVSPVLPPNMSLLPDASIRYPGLQHRALFLNGFIDDAYASGFSAQLISLDLQSPGEPIDLYINLTHGQAQAGLTIYETMNYIQSPVSTICIGNAL